MALLAACAAAFLAPSAAPHARSQTASGQQWTGGGSGGLVQTKHRDTGGDPKSRIVIDDSQTYKGTIEFKFTIDPSGEISGKGKGKYTAAEWTLSGSNGDKGPISCSLSITAKSFTVDVSGHRTNGTITLSLRLPDAEESNVDTPCPTNDFVAFGGTTHRLDESLAYSGGRSIKFTNLASGTPDNYTATLEPPNEDCSSGDINPCTVEHFWGITIGPSAFFSQSDKDRLAKSSQDLSTVAGGLSLVVVKKPTAVWAAFGSAAYWILSGINGRLSLDPPDRHFRQIARPRTPRFPALKPEDGLTPAAAAALNALAKNEAQMMGLGRALVTSVNRAQGAKRARNRRWTRLQLRAAHKYARRLAASARAGKRLRAQAKNAVAGSGYGGPSGITEADVRAFQEDVKKHGLPGWLDADLRAIGADASFRKQARGAILLLDPPKVVAATAIPDLVDNAQLETAIDTAIKALQDFSG